MNMRNLLKNIAVLLILLCATKAVAQQDLKITWPDGGEKLEVGTDVEIRWQGVPPQKFVILDYSTDNGQSWKRITDKATGLKHTWKVPNDASKQCLLRANLVNGTTPAEWARRGYGSILGAKNTSVAYDKDGNLFVTGCLASDSLDFGNGVVIYNHTKNRQYDIFIAKYDYAGTIQWARCIGGAGDDQAKTIKTDSLGNFYVSGSLGGLFQDSIDFGNGFILRNWDRIFYIAKFDNNGKTKWVREIKGATTNKEDVEIFTTIDRSGNIIAAGHSGNSFSPVLDFGNGFTIINPKTGEPNRVPFVAKYDSTGKILWAQRIKGWAGIYSVATDTSNTIYIGGGYTGDLDFGNGIVLGSSGGFLAQYSASGSVNWVREISGTDDISGVSGITVDRFNNVYMCGNFDSPTIDFGKGITLKKGWELDGITMYLARYTSDGDIIWAVQSNSVDRFTGVVNAWTISTDYIGNVVVGGYFDLKTVDFGNSVTLVNSTDGYTDPDIFLVKYNNAGKALWAKKAIGTDLEYLHTVVIDPFGSTFITGAYASNPLDFGGGNLLPAGGLFVAKFDNEVPVGTQDISDNSWSIIKPLATSFNIDMGKVLVATSKDSVITAFITNVGELPVDVSDIQITGANASEFSIVSGGAPFIMEVGEERSVQFRFIPAAIGIRSANLSIVTPLENFNQTIIGEGIQPLISISVPSIDMGIVEIGTQKDSILPAIVKNIGNAPLSITNTILTGKHQDQFQILSSAGSFILQAGEERTIHIRYFPQTIGRAVAQVEFEYSEMATMPAIAEITGFGIGGRVFIENDSAYAGESRFLKIRLYKHTAHNLQQQKPVSFKATVSYGNSIIAPAAHTAGVTIANSNTTGTVEITSQWNGTSTELAAIPFTATLGDRTETPVELLSFHWLNDAGEIINYDAELQNGVFKILGICEEGGARLYDANGRAEMMIVAPRPAAGVVTISFETIERGATTLMLTDALGQQKVLKSGDFGVGAYSFEFDAEGLASGMYILTMQTPTQMFTQQVIIGK